MKNILLLTENHINPETLTHESPHHAVFAWDKNYYHEKNFSLKQCVFFYEALCSMTVDIFACTQAELVRHHLQTGNSVSIIEPQHPSLATLTPEEYSQCDMLSPPTWLQWPETFHKKFFSFYKSIRKQIA